MILTLTFQLVEMVRVRVHGQGKTPYKPDKQIIK